MDLLKGKVILVVDDEPGYREVLMDEFQMVGATVLTAEGPARAFEILSTQTIDVVISDIRMASGSGVELLREIKNQNPSRPTVTLITGLSDLTLEEAYDLGAEAVFSKPCDLGELVKKVGLSMSSEKERWSRAVDSKDDGFKIQLNVEMLGVGRGGIFLPFEGAFPKINSRLIFKIDCNKLFGSLLEGSGTCRWCRKQSISMHPSGIGIEFEKLTEDSCSKYVKIINQQNPKAYIPRGLQ